MPPARLLLIAALGLVGCQGDSTIPSAGSGGPGGDEPVTMTLTVTPSLGLILNGEVTLSLPGAGWLATASTGNGGQASFLLDTRLAGPLLVTVCGNASATYYDEALDAWLPLGSDSCLRALLPDLTRSQIGISALSEAAVRYVESQGHLATATPADASVALEFVRSRALPEVADLLQAPAPVASASDLANLPADDAGRYALKLAALARAAKALGDSRGGIAAPALAIAEDLAADLADGSFDGAADGSYLVAASYDIHQLESLLGDQLSQLAQESSNLAALVGSLGDQPLLTSITPAPGSDPLLSWQGSYPGTWSGTSVYPGSLSGTSALVAFKGQLVTGTDCPIAISDTQVTVDGLPFGFALETAAVSDTDGYRTYSFQRQDTVTVTVSGFSQSMQVTTHARLITRGSQVLRVDTSADGVVMGQTLSNIANGSCTLPDAT